MQQATILIVDDDLSITDLLSSDLGEQGYNCVTAAAGEDALRRLSMGKVDVALLDLRLPGISGMEVLREIASTYPSTPVIMVTAVEDTETAVEAMKIGAVDYLTKPFKLGRVNESIESALQTMSVRKDKSTTRDSPTARHDEAYWIPHLDSIACGLEIRLESLTGHAQMVIGETVAIAQSLDIPEDQIDKWANARQKQIAERVNTMDKLVKRLERNPIAQIVLGITELHDCDHNSNSHLN